MRSKTKGASYDLELWDCTSTEYTTVPLVKGVQVKSKVFDLINLALQLGFTHIETYHRYHLHLHSDLASSQGKHLSDAFLDLLSRVQH